MKILVVALGCLAVVACSKAAEPHGVSTSSLTGTLSSSTFPSDPQLVEATNEAGARVATAPDANGAFALALTKGHSYRLSVILADSSEPVVFPRSGGALDTTFRVSSGAALVALGSVRHLDSAPQAGFKVKALAPASSGAAEGDDGECEDGVDAKTGAACVDDDGQLTCEAGDDQADGECENGTDALTGLACTDTDQEGENGADDEADGECENGVDAATGAACMDAEEADAAQPMAVAEHNVPDDIGGCDDSQDDGEEGDD